MKQIDRRDYFRGRDQQFHDQLTTEMDANADVTIDRVNQLLAIMQSEGLVIEDSQITGNPVTSGWRPVSVNKATPGAAVRSKHLTCQACDIFDPEGTLDDWLMTEHGQLTLVNLGLWLEHPSATKGWFHVQTIAPASGRRTFYP